MTYQITRDHSLIRAWAQERGGTPVVMHDAGEAIGINFGVPAPDFQRVTWAEFFERFDSQGLLFRFDPEASFARAQFSYSFIASGPQDTNPLAEDNEWAEENVYQQLREED